MGLGSNNVEVDIEEDGRVGTLYHACCMRKCTVHAKMCTRQACANSLQKRAFSDESEAICICEGKHHSYARR